MIGERLSHYRILGHLGAGGMGEVYRAEDTRLGREVALKVLPRETARNQAKLERFSREACAIAALNHPNIVTIYDVGEDHDMAYIAMELLQGKDLTYFCNHNNQLPINRILQIITQVAESLVFLK